MCDMLSRSTSAAHEDRTRRCAPIRTDRNAGEEGRDGESGESDAEPTPGAAQPKLSVPSLRTGNVTENSISVSGPFGRGGGRRDDQRVVAEDGFSRSRSYVYCCSEAWCSSIDPNASPRSAALPLLGVRRQ